MNELPLQAYMFPFQILNYVICITLINYSRIRHIILLVREYVQVNFYMSQQFLSQLRTLITIKLKRSNNYLRVIGQEELRRNFNNKNC